MDVGQRGAALERGREQAPRVLGIGVGAHPALGTGARHQVGEAHRPGGFRLPENP